MADPSRAVRADRAGGRAAAASQLVVFDRGSVGEQAVELWCWVPSRSRPESPAFRGFCRAAARRWTPSGHPRSAITMPGLPRRHPVPRTPQRTPVATWRTPPPGHAPLGQVRTPQRLAGATMWTALCASPRSCLGRRCRVGEQSNARGCSGRRTRLYRPQPEGRLHPRHQHSQSAPPRYRSTVGPTRASHGPPTRLRQPTREVSTRHDAYSQ